MYTQGASILRNPQTIQNKWTHYASLGDAYPLKAIPGVVSNGGPRVCQISEVRGDLETWTNQYLIIGNQYTDSRPRCGLVERLVIHCRVIAVEEQVRFELVRQRC